MAITPEQLLNVYRQGCFPMADSSADDNFYIVEPKVRGLLPIHDLHVPKSLAKVIKKQDFDIKVDENFEVVIRACQEATQGRPDTWINERIIQLFLVLHKQGHAHCVEVWRDNIMVGGLYGLALGQIFCGESMFSRTTNASKIALVHLCEILDQLEFQMLDAQFMNDHLKQFGAYEMPQSDYLKKLEELLPEQTQQFSYSK
jgi:leucyl/phenylalanyl-tRNA--protein transferase